jgi:hypothetical protein
MRSVDHSERGVRQNASTTHSGTLFMASDAVLSLRSVRPPNDPDHDATVRSAPVEVVGRRVGRALRDVRLVQP